MPATLTQQHHDSPLAWLEVTIASGASLSPEFNTRGFVPVSIRMPATWTAANLTFAGSEITAGTFADMYDDAGTEYTVVAAASRKIVLNPAAFCSFQFMKIRSGTAGAAVAQGGARILVVELRKLDRAGQGG
jgi:hypothetical protein